jgi:hypothetical protein
MSALGLLDLLASIVVIGTVNIFIVSAILISKIISFVARRFF